MLRCVGYLCALSILPLISQSSCGAEPGPIGPAPETVSVLYAGKSRSDRMAESVAFLSKHFARVGTCDLKSDIESIAADFDVVIVDWPASEPGADRLALRGPAIYQPVQLPQIKALALDKPLMVMGVIGLLTTNYPTVPLEQQSISVRDYAHDTKLNHPIFQGPLPVEIQLEQTPQPADYFLHPGGKNIGETLDAWRVQTGTNYPGIGFDAKLFERSTSAEMISCGLNCSRPNSMSIGRNGNVFYWGFSASPANMTTAGQSCYVNAICYMTGFKDQLSQPPVTRDYAVRDLFLDQIYELRRLDKRHFEASIDSYKRSLMLISLEDAEKALVDPPSYFRKDIEARAQAMLESVPADIRKQTGDDPEKLIAYYTQNLEYLYLDDERNLQVDVDVKSMGLSNRSHEFIKRLFAMLDDPKQTTLAQKLTKRYVDYQANTPEEWHKFQSENGSGLTYQPWKEKFGGLPLWGSPYPNSVVPGSGTTTPLPGFSTPAATLPPSSSTPILPKSLDFGQGVTAN